MIRAVPTAVFPVSNLKLPPVAACVHVYETSFGAVSKVTVPSIVPPFAAKRT